MAALAAGLLALFAAANPARAATTFTVNSTDDKADQNTANGVCDTGLLIFPTGEPQCTLRAAIQQANATSGADNIGFNIPGTGPHTITPSPVLPTITDTVTLDGYTEDGASENTQEFGTDAVLKIELDGTNAGTDPNGRGLTINASNVVVRGLVINRFPWQGISIDSGAHNRIEGNFIGTDPTGTLDRGNATAGVGVFPAAGDTVVGGTSPAARNVISGNDLEGVGISGPGTRVQGNLIGTDRSKTENLGNGDAGVSILVGSCTVGGNGAAANVIAFNRLDGVDITNSNASGNRILSNSIFSNGGLGIDLLGPNEHDGTDARAPNDHKDPDTGPNDLQNFPVITSAKTSRKFTLIKGKLNSTPSQTFTIRLFASPKDTKDEGKTFIGELDGVTTDPTTGDTLIMVPVQKVKPGQFVTATATNDATGDTSEFSAAKKVVRKR